MQIYKWHIICTTKYKKKPNILCRFSCTNNKYAGVRVGHFDDTYHLYRFITLHLNLMYTFQPLFTIVSKFRVKIKTTTACRYEFIARST